MVLVGITRLVSKKSGKDFCILHFLCDGDDHTEGKKVMTEFVNPSVADYSLIGEEVELVYSKGFDGRAVLEKVVAA